MQTKIRAHKNIFEELIELYIFDKASVATPIVFKEREIGEYNEPTLTITTEQAQALMDNLYNLGIRPTDAKGSNAGALEATQKHLEDMRKIAFNYIELKSK